MEEFVTSHPPSSAEIAVLRERVRDFDLVVVGTINADRPGLYPTGHGLAGSMVVTA